MSYVGKCGEVWVNLGNVGGKCEKWVEKCGKWWEMVGNGGKWWEKRGKCVKLGENV